MTIIKAACPTCGDVELTKDQVRLVVHTVRSRSFYSFDCTSCVSQVKKPAGDEVVRLLTLGGVVAERIEVPAEALEVHDGKKLTSDDLLDFAAWLVDAENVVQAAGTGLHYRLLPGGDRGDGKGQQRRDRHPYDGIWVNWTGARRATSRRRAPSTLTHKNTTILINPLTNIRSISVCLC